MLSDMVAACRDSLGEEFHFVFVLPPSASKPLKMNRLPRVNECFKGFYIGIKRFLMGFSIEHIICNICYI